jgi:hypothetical protein
MALERLTYTQPLLQSAGGRATSQATASRRVVMVSVDGEGADLARASISADLGGSSKYTSENLVD